MLGKVLLTLLVSRVQTVITVALAAVLFHIHLYWHRMPLALLVRIAVTAGWFFFYSIFALSTRRGMTFLIPSRPSCISSSCSLATYFIT